MGVGEEGENTLFERKGKKDPSIRSKSKTHFDTHVGFFKYCHKTFLITAWAMQVLPYAPTIAAFGRTFKSSRNTKSYFGN